jgi:peptidoglycan L-alanyl-D-glutamate endopeptidase CwlK
MIAMSIETPDRDYGHLYPEFRRRLQQVTQAMLKQTGLEWHLMEGYRSLERQRWLYAQGRTRPGPVVTWMKSPLWHGSGLAADLAPVKDGEIWYGAPLKYWELLRVTGARYGLTNPAFRRGDHGHLQLGDAHLRELALAWIGRGFPAG